MSDLAGQTPLRPAAPVWHTVLLLSVLLTVSAAGAVNRGSAAARDMPHLGYYVYVIVMEAVFLALCLWKVNAGFRGYLARVLQDRAGLRLDLWLSLGLFAVFVFVLPLLLRLILGNQGWESLQDLKPTGGLQRALWVEMSIVAGVCEEIVFRGYLLQQFGAWARNVRFGVLAQAAAFGLAHGYQGWKNMTLIAALGLLLGTVAVARRNLRAGMLAHAALDTVSGFF